MQLERISIEVSQLCNKACWFCYSTSSPTGGTQWTPTELIAFIEDCAIHKVKAVSFGGGEPLQYDGLFQVLEALQGKLFRSVTTNGLLLEGPLLEKLVAAKPDKVHVSIHFPENPTEIARALSAVRTLEARGIRSGINYLVSRSKIRQALIGAQFLRASGVTNDRIVYLPMRGQDTPTPHQISLVAGAPRLNFQSMTCLRSCAKSPRFCSISWEKTVAWCSYTKSRRVLEELTYGSLINTLQGLGLEYCGGRLEHV